jgi:hypothetical protein
MRGMVRCYDAFATFCVRLSLALHDYPVALAFAVAAVAAHAVQLLSKHGIRFAARDQARRV